MNSPVLVALILAISFDHPKQGLSVKTGKFDWQKIDIPINGSGEPYVNDFDRSMIDYMRSVGAPGGALTIFYRGKKVYAKGFGYADVRQSMPFTASTPSRISSLSKYLTRQAIKKLINSGDLREDTKMVDVLAKGGIIPKPQKGKTVDPRLSNITILQLLDHTSGLNPGLNISTFTKDEFAKEMGFESPISAMDALGLVIGQPLESDPGKKFNYSNNGYALLGKMIQIVSGKPYEEFVKTNVLQPKINPESWFVTSSQRKDRRPDEAEYYARESTPTWGEYRWDIFAGAGGWVAPTEGIAEFFAKEFPGSNWTYTLFGSYTGAVTVLRIHKNSLVYAASINYRRGDNAKDNEVLFKRLEAVAMKLKLPQ